MSTPAVIQLQEYATNEQHDVSELLRKALLVATKLKLSDFKEWLSNELNGYNDGELRVQHPYSGLIPFIIKDNEKLEKAARIIQIHDSVSSLSNLAQSKDSLLSARLPQAIEEILMRMQNSSVQYPPVRVFTVYQVVSIINTVRTQILEWALALEEEGIQGEGLTFSSQEKKIVENSPAMHIENFQGIRR
jgi:hypothetical protein